MTRGGSGPARVRAWQRNGYLLLGLATLCLTVHAGRTVWLFPYDGLAWDGRTGRVSRVDPHGPGFAAGIRPGDRLLALDGVDLRESARVYSRKRVGDTLRALVEGGQRRTATLLLSTPPAGVRARRIEPLAVGLVYSVAGLAALAFVPWQEVTHVFFLLGQAAAAMLAAGSLSTTLDPAGMALFNALILPVALLTLHLLALFPERVPPRRRRPLLRGSYALTLVLSLGYLALTGGPSGRLAPDAFRATQYTAVAGNLGLALALLLRAPRPSAFRARRRHRLLLAGITLSLMPLLSLSFVPELLQLGWQVDYTWTFPFLALLPLSFGYAMRQGELGPVDLFLNRSLVLALLVLPLAGVAAIMVTAVSAFAPASSAAWVMAATAMVLAAAGVVNGLRSALQRRVDRLFYGGWYDYRSVIRQASRELSRIRDLDALVQQLLDVARTMRFEAAAILCPHDGRWQPRGAYGFSMEETAQLELPLAAATTAPPAEAATVGLAADSPERALAAVPGVEYSLPLVSGGELQAILLLSGRRGAEPLAPEDHDLLTTLAAQAAVAAENVALLEALTAKVAELTAAQDEAAEVRHRLVEAREAERQHLARELHDGPLQELEALRLLLASAASRPGSGQAGAGTAALEERVLAAIATLRDVCRELRPPALAPFGLAAAIASDVERLRALHPGLEIDTDLAADGKALPERLRSALYRIYREAMSNVERHAGARHIRVRLTLERGQVVLTVSDDGRGFEVPARWITLARAGRLGLLGAAERAEAVGARLDVESTPLKGTAVRVACALHDGREASAADGGDRAGDACARSGGAHMEQDG